MWKTLVQGFAIVAILAWTVVNLICLYSGLWFYCHDEHGLCGPGLVADAVITSVCVAGVTGGLVLTRRLLQGSTFARKSNAMG